jgi:hypothetical protein
MGTPSLLKTPIARLFVGLNLSRKAELMLEISGDHHTVAGVKAGQYIRSIRNAAKKEYARAYLLFLLQGRQGTPPEQKELSYMAAQAVRLHLGAIFPEQPEETP